MRGLDSNQNLQVKGLLCCHYTTPPNAAPGGRGSEGLQSDQTRKQTDGKADNGHCKHHYQQSGICDHNIKHITHPRNRLGKKCADFSQEISHSSFSLRDHSFHKLQTSKACIVKLKKRRMLIFRIIEY